MCVVGVECECVILAGVFLRNLGKSLNLVPASGSVLKDYTCTLYVWQYMYCTLLCRVWLDGVLPMVMDREVGAQEKCLQLLEDVILNNITTPKRYSSLPPSHFIIFLFFPLQSSLSFHAGRHQKHIVLLGGCCH